MSWPRQDIAVPRIMSYIPIKREHPQSVCKSLYIRNFYKPQFVNKELVFRDIMWLNNSSPISNVRQPQKSKFYLASMEQF